MPEFLPLPLATLHTFDSLPDDLSIAEGDVQVVWGSVSYPNTATNVFRGTYRGQPARVTEYRSPALYGQTDTEMFSMLVRSALLRRLHQSSRHVCVSGLYQTSASLGGKVFLVEAPYYFTGLPDYLAANPDADRRILVKDALEIVADIHSKGLVHGLIQPKSFVVDPSGKLFLSEFETMRMEDPTVPFHPVGGLSTEAMAFLAPELLDSLREEGHAGFTRVTDMYSMGCLIYELLVGESPFASYHRKPPPISQAMLITAVVDRNQRPEKPEAGSDAFTRFGLTNEIWGAFEECWAIGPEMRPSAPCLLRRFL